MTTGRVILPVTIICFSIAASLVFISCAGHQVAAASDSAGTQPQRTSASPPVVPCDGRPILLGIAQDKTGSAQSNPTPQLKAMDLRPLYELLRCSGGEMAFGIITGKSSQNLVRLRVDEQPLIRKKRPDNPNPFLEEEEMSDYRKEKNLYDNQLHDWQQKTQGDIQAFEQEIQPLLKLLASAGRTDFFGTLQQLELFEREPRPGWDGRVRRWLLIVSDAQDNVHKPIPSLPAGTHFLLVFGGDIPTKVKALKPIQFENVESAVRYIVNMREQ